jgi:hypothetical protein
MGPELHGLARALIFFGVILAGFGIVLLLAPKIPWIGRLPGDILITRPPFTFYFPLASCLVASLLVSLAWWLFSRLK